jgi:hypothetical protein
MAWAWSHSAEAYENARINVGRHGRTWLKTVFAEWHACADPHEDSNEFDERKYNRALRRAQKLPNETLADYIWERMSEYALCDSGGTPAWCCPSGCHTVPFDLQRRKKKPA